MLLKKLRQRFFTKNKITQLERFTENIQWADNFNSPEAYYDYYFVDRDTGIVGKISGGMSPLQDTFYLFKIEVPLKHQRKHYELSILANIAHFYDVPITPMQGIDSALLSKIGKMSRGHFQLNAQISGDKMVAEILNWTRVAKAIDKQQVPQLIRKAKICG